MTFAITGATGLGVEVRAVDYEKPQTLDEALAGVDTLLLISSSEIGRRAARHGNVIAAAKKAGVRRIVYTSLLHADTSPLAGLAPEHVATEAAIKGSGIPYTILRNGWYTENYTGGINGAVQAGVLVGSAGAGKISSVSTQTGKALPYRNLPQADYAAVLQGVGLPERIAQAVAGFDVGASNGALFDDSRQLSRLIGRPTTSLADAVASALGT